MSFAFAGSGDQSQGTCQIEFYPYRVGGSGTAARLLSLQSLSLMGQGDGNNYFIQGLRRPGYLQGHEHRHIDRINGGGNAENNVNGSNSGGSDRTLATLNMVADSSNNGVPRVGKETHGPIIGSHWYIHAGRFIA